MSVSYQYKLPYFCFWLLIGFESSDWSSRVMYAPKLFPFHFQPVVLAQWVTCQAPPEVFHPSLVSDQTMDSL